MNDDSRRAEAVRYWWGKAMESRDAARRDLAAGDLALAVNRIYYALFYAVSALLLQQGKTFTKHSGVRATFNREIIRPGVLSRRHGELYNRLFRDRQKGDYAVFAEFDHAYVNTQLEGCEGFLEEVRSMLTPSFTNVENDH